MALTDVVWEFAPGDTMLTATPTWVDITSYVRQASINRGRSSLDGRFGTGVAEVTLDNRDGRFNPDNTTGAYFPDVSVGVPFRCRETTTSQPIFYGSARGFPPTYPKGGDSFVTVSVVDGFYTLNLEELHDETYAAESTNTRIGNVLDDIGWPAGLRDLDAGVASVQATSFAVPETGGEHPALFHVQDVAEAEVGTLFMARDGKVTFRNRIANSGATASATFNDSAISELRVAYDDDFLFNDFRIAREDGIQVNYTNATSVTAHGRRVLTRDVMPMGNDAEVLSVATWLDAIFGNQRLRVEELKLKLHDSAVFFSDALSLELRDVVQVTHIPEAGDTISELCAVEFISHDMVPGDWTVTLSLVPLTAAELEEFFILDSSLLDGTDVLA